MKIFRLRICRYDRRRWKGLSLLMLTTFNLLFVLFLIYSIKSLTNNSEDFNTNISQKKFIKNDEFDDEMLNVTMNRRRERKEQYDFYFRINYQINQGICKSIELFNTMQNLISIENFTNTKLQSLFGDNLTIQIDIFSITPKLLKSEKIQKNALRKSSRTVCDYLLELSIGFDFVRNCDSQCKGEQIRLLTSNTRPFERQLDHSSFIFYPLNQYDSTTTFQINQIFIYQTSIFLDRPVYIRSFHEIRYVSALIVDPEGAQSSVTMSQIDRTLFLIKDGLHDEPYSRESSVIYISFLSTTVSNTYLRHENARIKLGKSDQSILFKQDATFKLIFGTTRKDVMAFESINLPQHFIGVDPDSQTAIILAQPTQLVNDIELMDQRFLFKLVFNQ